MNKEYKDFENLARGMLQLCLSNVDVRVEHGVIKLEFDDIVLRIASCYLLDEWNNGYDAALLA